MIELERSLISNFRKIKLWRRFVDDSICFVYIGPTDYIRSVLNSFHKNIRFTYEMGSNAKLPFADMLLMRNHKDIATTVYRKESNSDVYLYWDSLTLTLFRMGEQKGIPPPPPNSHYQFFPCNFHKRRN